MILSEDKTKKMTVWSSEKKQLVGCWHYGQILVMKWRNHWSRLLVLAPFLAFTCQLEATSFWWIQLKKKSQLTKSEHLEERFRACHTQDLVKVRPLIQRHTLVQWGGHDRPQATCQGQLSRTNVFPRSLVCSDISHVWGLPTANWYQLGLSTYKTSQEANRIFSGYPNKKTWNTQPFLENCLGAPGKSSLQRLNQNMAVSLPTPAPRDLKKLEASRSLGPRWRPWWLLKFAHKNGLCFLTWWVKSPQIIPWIK